MMVVVVIIGLLSVGATYMYNGGGPKSDLHDAIEKFTIIGERMGEMATLTGQPMGLILIPPAWNETDPLDSGWHYKWKRSVTLSDGQGSSQTSWIDIEDIDAIELEKEIELYVRINDDEWEWENIPKGGDIPLLSISPSGEVEPFEFEVEFAHENMDIEPQHVKLNESGQLEWAERVEALKELQERMR